jgi:hypothetical protein
MGSMLPKVLRNLDALAKMVVWYFGRNNSARSEIIEFETHTLEIVGRPLRTLFLKSAPRVPFSATPRALIPRGFYGLHAGGL